MLLIIVITLQRFIEKIKTDSDNLEYNDLNHIVLNAKYKIKHIKKCAKI